MTYSIAVSNEKGGVAKTTTTLSLGAALAELNHRVLLIDLDPQANLSLALGLETGEAEITSANVLIENSAIKSAIRRTDVANLELIPSNSRIESAEQYLPMRSNYLSTLRQAILTGTLNYDYILFDCPPALGAITLNALSASDLLIIPTQAEYFSAYALRNMMGSIRRIRQESNPNLAYRILVTLLDRRNRTHRNIFEQLQTTFGQGVFTSVIEIDTKLRESPIAGMPITQYRPTSRGSQQYRVLAQELIEYAKEEAGRQTA
ncbi:MAG: chromosome partitioning protein ParA [Anaerolineae bacterium]|nr:Sporulation initiation inhibitor protein Soj [Anaerolineales bacterium]RIK28848.1 MAG: chromosome partitioning protein ParA [Anaerolineae bacterium]WKZ45947.1 MAG: ParA family protein [Anaerolineales bacterium]WKZ48594.1 MAG: ParA family protein [Anaerolineales bacterium]